MAEKILVIGGTGMRGQPVADRLIADGYSVRIMTHFPEKAGKIPGLAKTKLKDWAENYKIKMSMK